MTRMAMVALAVLPCVAALAETRTNLHYYAQEGDRAGVEKELRRGVDFDARRCTPKPKPSPRP